MRSFAIEEPGSPVPALYATLPRSGSYYKSGQILEIGHIWEMHGSYKESNISQDNIGSDFVTGSHFHQRTHFTF